MRSFATFQRGVTLTHRQADSAPGLYPLCLLKISRQIFKRMQQTGYGQPATLADRPTKLAIGDNTQMHPLAGLQVMDDVEQIVSVWVASGAKHSHQALSWNSC